MKFWLQYLAKLAVLYVLLIATALFAIRYPAMWSAPAHTARLQSVPAELFAVTRLVLPVLLAFGWFVYAVAAKRVGRPQ